MSGEGEGFGVLDGDFQVAVADLGLKAHKVVCRERLIACLVGVAFAGGRWPSFGRKLLLRSGSVCCETDTGKHNGQTHTCDG